MNVQKPSAASFFSFVGGLLAVVTAISPSGSVIAQTNAAHRAIRQNAQRVGGAAEPVRRADVAQGATAHSSKRIDLTYVLSDAVAAVVLRPAQIMSSPAGELLPTEVASAAGLQYLGFDPADIEEAIVFVGQLNPMAPTQYALVIKFTKPFRGTSINPQRRAHTQSAELAGKRYLQSQTPTLPSFYAPNNRTLIVAPDATLRQLIESAGQMKRGPVIDRLKDVAAGNDLYAAVDVIRFRPFTELAIVQAKASGRLPLEAQEILDVSKLISSAELTLNITPAGPISLMLYATDQAAAEQLETVLTDITGHYPIEALADASASADDDLVTQAVLRYIERFSRPFRPRREGTKVIMFHVEAQSRLHQQLASTVGLAVGSHIHAAFQAGTQHYVDVADQRAAEAQVGLYKNAIQMYRLDTRQYPSDLKDLVTKPSDTAVANRWDGPYLDNITSDPWGNDFRLCSPGKFNPDSFDVWSVGPDGQDGSADDIGNW
jgi:type II secretion system protein G